MPPLFVIPYPVINPVAFHLGPMEVRWYGLAYMAGILLGWLYARNLVSRDDLWAKKSPISKTQLDDFLLWVTLGIVVGGRIGYVLFYQPIFYFEHPWQIPAVWGGGMSFHGGLLGVTLAVYLFSRKHKISPLSLGDVAAAAAPFGLFFGRIANFINGEVVGRVIPASLRPYVPWGMVFPGWGPLPRHPSQLYEATLEGVVLFLILFFATRKYRTLSRPGETFGLFLVFYGIFRSAVELVRQPNAGNIFDISFLTAGIVYSIPMIIVGIWLIWRAKRKAAGVALEGNQSADAA